MLHRHAINRTNREQTQGVAGVERFIGREQVIVRKIRFPCRDTKLIGQLQHVGPINPAQTIDHTRSQQLAIAHNKTIVTGPFCDKPPCVEHNGPGACLFGLELSLKMVHFVAHFGARLQTLWWRAPNPSHDTHYAVHEPVSKALVVHRQSEYSHSVPIPKQLRVDSDPCASGDPMVDSKFFIFGISINVLLDQCCR